METNKLIVFRKLLHKYPELSGKEVQTAKRLEKFFYSLKPNKVIKSLGGNGICFVFGDNDEEPLSLFRADMDALPINEVNSFEHQSIYKNIAHKCGHDGHMTILAGLAAKISKNRPTRGNTMLLFQPAEEIGQGAKAVIDDPLFKNIKPNYVFGLHNIPGFEKNKILIRDGIFALASTGFKIELYGKTSHAGEPQKGLNPAKATSSIIAQLIDLPKNEFFNDAVSTIVHINLGEIAYGTSAGYAEIRATLRSNTTDELQKMIAMAEKIVSVEAEKEGLKSNTLTEEYFPAIENNHELNQMVMQAAQNANLELCEISQPFKWSEDFSHFGQHFNAAFFGLGSGENTPKLHNPEYDFPDEIIPAGIDVFYQLYQTIHRS